MQPFGLLGKPRGTRAEVERARTELANLEAVLPVLAAAITPGLAEDRAVAVRLRHLAVATSTAADERLLLGNVALAILGYVATNDALARLATAEPNSPDRQRDIAVSWNRLGDVRQAQGNLAGALVAYEASLANGQRLAEADPGNAGWQRDLIVSHRKIAAVLQEMPDRHGEAAAAHWAEALAAARELAGSGRLAPPDGYFVEELERRLAAAEGAAREP